MSWLGNATLALAIATVAVAETPPAAARAALADLQTQPAERRANLRYLVVEQPEQVVAVNYALNAVSRSRLIVRAEAAGAHLLRIDLAALANPRDATTLAELRAAWEKMVAIDPYFHLRTQVVAPQVLSSGTVSRVGKQPASAQPSRVLTVTVDGGWIPADVAHDLRVAALSAGAVLRSDFFVAHATTAPLYYDFAGIPSTESAAARATGRRSRHGRSPGGRHRGKSVYLASHQQAAATGAFAGSAGGHVVQPRHRSRDAGSRPAAQPGELPRRRRAQALRYDASEWFAQKENRFWLTAVYDARGQRQDAVKDVIAKDTLAHDGVVRPLISCVRCHELNGGSAGMQPIADDQYPLLTGEAAVLRSFVPEVARRVAELYDPARLARDQARSRGL